MKLLLILLSLFFSSLTDSNEGYKPGDLAADFELINTDDKLVSLKQFKEAKGFIIVFTCNHCPFSVLYEQRIMDLDKQYAAKGYPVIAINPNDPLIQPDDSPEKMKERAKKKKYTFPYLFDGTQQVAALYGARRTPHVYVLNKEEDKYRVAYIGAIDDNPEHPKDAKEKYVENAVESLLAGKQPNPNMTKAIGCSIKWKQN